MVSNAGGTGVRVGALVGVEVGTGVGEGEILMSGVGEGETRMPGVGVGGEAVGSVSDVFPQAMDNSNTKARANGTIGIVCSLNVMLSP